MPSTSNINKTDNGQIPLSVKISSNQSPQAIRQSQDATTKFLDWVDVHTASSEVTKNAILRALIELVQTDPTIESKALSLAKELSHTNKRANRYQQA